MQLLIMKHMLDVKLPVQLGVLKLKGSTSPLRYLDIVLCSLFCGLFHHDAEPQPASRG